MIRLVPNLLRAVTRSSDQVISTSKCFPLAGLYSVQWSRSIALQTAFRSNRILLQKQLPPHNTHSTISQNDNAATPSRKPEDLFPESFPSKEEDLVNPSGRIYSIKRPPTEEEEGQRKESQEENNRRAAEITNPEAYRYSVPLDEVKRPAFIRPILFLGFGGLLFYFVAAKVSIDNTRDRAEKVLQSGRGGGIFGDFSTFFGRSGNADRPKDPRRYEGVSEAQLKASKNHELAGKLGENLTWLMKKCDQFGLPEGGKTFVSRVFLWGAEAYLNSPETKSILVPIIAINAVVFFGWRISMAPSLRNTWERFMKRHFLHAPASGRSYTLLTSTFSHMGFIHLFLNNFALWSFGASALVTQAFYRGQDGKGKHTSESSLGPHFWAFFATAGIFSALVAHLLTAFSFPVVAARLGSQIARSNIGRTGSLGASGAVYSVLIMSALAMPELNVGMIFLPGVYLPIQDGVKLLLLFDLIGMFVPFSPLGHSAHLGGALFGYLYFYYGSQIWEGCKAQIRLAEQNSQS